VTDDYISGRQFIWSRRGDQLLGILAICLMVGVAWWWIGVFYLEQPYNEIISFRAVDTVGYDVAGFVPVQIIGGHTFSDFQVPLSWAHAIVFNNQSPYLGLNPYAPLVPLLYAPLAFLPTAGAFWLFITGVLIAALIPIWRMLSPQPWSARMIILLLTTMATAPMIANLDRANVQLVIFACLSWVLWACSCRPRGRWKLASAALAFAIAIKAYPVLLLVGPLALRRYRFVIVTAGTALIMTIGALLVLPAGPVENARRYIGWLVGYGDDGVWSGNWSFQSLLRQSTDLATSAGTADALFGGSPIVAFAPGLLWLALLAVVISRGRVPQWCWGPLLLATLQVAVPVSYTYITSWAILAAIWFGRGDLINLEGQQKSTGNVSDAGQRLLALSTAAMLTATLTPFAFRFIAPSGAVISVMPLLSPLLIALTGVLALALSLWPKAQTPVTQPATP